MNEITMDINDYLTNRADIIKKNLDKPIDKLTLTGIAPKTLISLFSNIYNEDLCINCKIIDVSNLDTSNVTDMGYMFYNCKNLEKIKGLDKFDTSKVTDMSWMFLNCKNLKTLDLSNFDTSNVKYMAWMFSNCENLKTLDISNFDMKNVCFSYNIFNNCPYFDTFKLPDDERFNE